MLSLLSQTGYFDTIKGIEILLELVSIAEANMQNQGIKNVEIITSDARSYSDIDNIDCFFMFNPFPVEAMATVVSEINNSLDRKKRSVCIIYANNILDSYLQKNIPGLVKKEEMKNLPRFGCQSAIYIVNGRII